MANDCSFEIKAVSKKKEALEQLIQYLQNEYDQGPHPWRVFDAEGEDEITKEKELYTVKIRGYCAWSVYSCMFEGTSTYQSEYGAEDKNGKTISEMCRKLKVAVEIFSDEPGIGFQEHYIINKDGEICDDETGDATTYWWDKDEYPTIEDFNKEFDTDLSEDDFNEDGDYTEGGYAQPYDWTYKLTEDIYNYE